MSFKLIFCATQRNFNLKVAAKMFNEIIMFIIFFLKSQKESQDTKDRFSSLEEQINNTTKKANYSFENNQRVQKELQEVRIT